MNSGDIDEAKDVLTRALDGFEELGERWGLAMTLSTLDSTLRRSGCPTTTAPAERAMTYFRELGLPEHAMENEEDYSEPSCRIMWNRPECHHFDVTKAWRVIRATVSSGDIDGLPRQHRYLPERDRCATIVLRA